MYGIIELLNRIGGLFCTVAWAMLWQSVVVITALYLIDFLIRKHTRAVFRYCIWMLVFVKLIVPPGLCLPTGLGYWCDFYTGSEPAATQKTAAQQTPYIAQASRPLADIPRMDGEPANIPAPSTPAVQEAAMPQPSAAITAPAALTRQAVVFLAWLVGVLVLSVLLLQRFLFVKSLIAQSDKADGGINSLLACCREQIGLEKDIELRLSKSMLSPAACGLNKPVILMPAALLDKLTEEKLRAVLLHELAHIKRGDLWLNFIQTILQIVYFYNPFLWLANATVRGLREKAVDEMVLTKLGDAAHTYSNTLIDVAEIAFSKPHFSLRLVGVVESKKALTGRIKHILNRPLPKSAKLGAAGMAAIIIAAAVLLPMAKAKETVANPDKFIKTLSNGVTIELVGVCEFPSEGKQWWRPDGAGFEPDFHTKQRGQVSSNGKPYEIAVKVDGPDDLSFRWGTAKGQTGSSMLDVLDSGNNHIDDIKAQRINIDKMGGTTTVEVGAATGQWETRFDNPVTGNGALASGGHNIIFSNTYKVDGGIEVTVSDDFLDMEHRLILIDKTGKTHTTQSHGGSTAGKVRQFTYKFNDVAIENVKEYQFQTRPYQWIEFKNISLRPNKSLSNDSNISDSLHFKSKSARVVDSQGKPIEGAFVEFSKEISLSSDTNNTQQRKMQWDGGSAITDNNGRFQMPRLPVPDDTVYVSFDAKISAVGFLTRDNIALGQNYDNDKGVIDLLRPAVIEGVLLDMNKQPLAEASISLRSHVKYNAPNGSCSGCYDDQVNTDGQGYFRFANVPPGHHYLVYPGNRSSDSLCPVQACAGLNVEVQESQNIEGLVIDLSNSTAVLKGKIIDENNKPVEGAYVYLQKENKAYRDEKNYTSTTCTICSSIKQLTGSDGLFSLVNVQPGEYIARASYPYVEDADREVGKSVNVILTPNKTTEQDLTIKRQDLSKAETKDNSRITKYRVNRTVKDFNDETDLSTPEAAYAAATRIYASGEHYRWKEISTKESAEKQKDITEADNADIPSDLKNWLLDTVVLEVMFCANHAAVIGERPLELQGTVVKERYDCREFLYENDKWLYTGHGGGRFESIDEAEKRFTQSLKEYGINVAGVDNLPQPPEYAKTSNAIIAQSEVKPEADDGKIEIGGMVVDENTNPILNVSVDVLWGMFNGMGMSSPEKVQTDEQGRWFCRVPRDVNRFSVRLRHPEYYSIDFEYQPLIGNLKDKSSVLVMRKGMSFYGRVVDSKGNPVANAILMPPDSVTTISAADGLVETASTTRTKDDGTFMLAGVKNEPQEIVVDAEGFSPAIFDYDPQKNKREDIIITLPDAAALRGIVRDNLGNAVAGVKLKTDRLLVKKDDYDVNSGERFSWDQRINILRRQTTTNEDGSFILTGLPPAGVFELFIIPKERNKFLISWKHIDLAAQTGQAEYTIYPVPVITGKVVDMQSREPVKDISIVAGGEWQDSQGIEWIPGGADKINTDDGSFEKAIRYISISDTNCSVVVRITADGYLPYISPKVRVDQKCEPLLVELKKGDNITGTIFGHDGMFAENTEVAWSSPKTKFYIQGYEFGKGFADRPESFVKTDGNGRFKFTPSDEDWTIMALNKKGYCIISKQEYKPDGRYTMTPWAIVEGNISKSLLGTDNLTISMIPANRDKFYWGVSLTPNIDGSFRYDYVPSIPLTLKLLPNKPSHLKDTVEFAAGQKYNINITEYNKWICEPQVEKLD